MADFRREHDQAREERKEIRAKLEQLEAAVFNGLRDRVERIDKRVWWIIVAIVGANVLTAAGSMILQASLRGHP